MNVTWFCPTPVTLDLVRCMNTNFKLLHLTTFKLIEDAGQNQGT